MGVSSLTAIAHVGIVVKQAIGDGWEMATALDDGHVIRVANNLGVVEVDDGLCDQIGSGWKVDGGGLGGRSGAWWAAAQIARANSGIDGSGVVGDCVLVNITSPRAR